MTKFVSIYFIGMKTYVITKPSFGNPKLLSGEKTTRSVAHMSTGATQGLYNRVKNGMDVVE